MTQCERGFTAFYFIWLIVNDKTVEVVYSRKILEEHFYQFYSGAML